MPSDNLNWGIFEQIEQNNVENQCNFEIEIVRGRPCEIRRVSDAWYKIYDIFSLESLGNVLSDNYELRLPFQITSILPENSERIRKMQFLIPNLFLNITS